MTNFDHLIDDVILYILSFIEPHPISIARISAVNRKFNQLVSRLPTVKKRQERKKSGLDDMQKYESFLEQLQQPEEGGLFQSLYQIVRARHQSQKNAILSLSKADEEQVIATRIKVFFISKARQFIQYWWMTFDELWALTEELIQKTNAVVTSDFLHDWLSDIKPYVQQKLITHSQCLDCLKAHLNASGGLYIRFSLLKDAIEKSKDLIERDLVRVSDLFRLLLPLRPRHSLRPLRPERDVIHVVQVLCQFQSLLEREIIKSPVLIHAMINRKERKFLTRLQKVITFMMIPYFIEEESSTLINDNSIELKQLEFIFIFAHWVPTLISVSQWVEYVEKEIYFDWFLLDSVLPWFKMLDDYRKRGADVSFLKSYSLSKIIQLFHSFEQHSTFNLKAVSFFDMINCVKNKGLLEVLDLINSQEKVVSLDETVSLDFKADKVLIKAPQNELKTTPSPSFFNPSSQVVSGLVAYRQSFHAEINQWSSAQKDRYQSRSHFLKQPPKAFGLVRRGFGCTIL